MTQFTWNRGTGFPGPYSDADFTTDPSGPAAGQWTWNRGLGFLGPYNDSSFVTDPGTPGGDIVAVSSTFAGEVAGTFVAISGFDVVVGMYGGVDGSLNVDGEFFVLRADVDDIDLEIAPIGDIDVEWV